MKKFVLILLIGCGLDGQAAREEAEVFAKQTLGFEQPVVDCQNYDSNDDGYVSCTVVDRATNDREAIECSGWWSWNSGCRLATGARGPARTQ